MDFRKHPLVQVELGVLVAVDDPPDVGKQGRLCAAMAEVLVESARDLIFVSFPAINSSSRVD
jgi:hypothetical protein